MPCLPSLRKPNLRISLVRVPIVCLLGVCSPGPGSSGDARAQSEIERHSVHYAPPVFGEVAPELLAMQADHGFPYEILDKVRVVGFEEGDEGIIARIEDVHRIKIHTDDPEVQLQAGLVVLPMLRGRDNERIDGIRGINHLPDGRTLELQPADIRRTQYNSQIDLVEFLIPGIEAGSVIEYRYRITRSGIEELPMFHFSDRVPVRRASLHMVHQPYMRHDDALNDPGSLVRFEAERIDTSSARLLFSERRPEPLLITHWIAERLPAEEMTYDTDPAPDARTGIRFLIGEFGLPRQPLENSWDVVNARLRRQSDPFQLTAASSSARLRALGDSLASRHAGDPFALVSEAGEILRSRIRSDGARGIFPGVDPLDSVLDSMAADQASLNLGLMAILRGAGLQVEPVYHSWSRFGRMDTLFPSIHQLQGVVLAVKPPPGDTSWSGWLLVDASNEAGRPGLIPADVAGQQGFRLSADGGFAWSPLEGEENRFSTSITFSGRLTSRGDVVGRLRLVLAGYPAQKAALQMAAGTAPDSYVRTVFLDRYDDVSFTRVDLLDRFRDDGEIEFNVDVALAGIATAFSDGIDFTPMVSGYIEQNPFEPAARKTPVQLDVPEFLSLEVRLSYPKGMTPEIPDMVPVIAIPGARFEQSGGREGDELVYRFALERSGTRFRVSEYEILRTIYARWLALSQERWRMKGTP